MLEYITNDIVIFSICIGVLCILAAVGICFACRWANRKFSIQQHADSFDKKLSNWIHNTVPGSFTAFAFWLWVFMGKPGWISGFFLFCFSYSLLINCLDYIKNKG